MPVLQYDIALIIYLCTYISLRDSTKLPQCFDAGSETTALMYVCARVDIDYAL